MNKRFLKTNDQITNIATLIDMTHREISGYSSKRVEKDAKENIYFDVVSIRSEYDNGNLRVTAIVRNKPLRLSGTFRLDGSFTLNGYSN
jgi:hypothetical protein